MSPESWESFFLGELGAAAALGGLLFVAVSINVAKIVAEGGLADRALLALLILIGILIFGLLMLMPNQSLFAMGAEIVLVTVLVTAMGTILSLRGLKASEGQYRRHYILNIVAFEIAMLPCLIGGVLVLAGNQAGLYWLAIGICLCFVKAVSDAWIFLVEINR